MIVSVMKEALEKRKLRGQWVSDIVFLLNRRSQLKCNGYLLKKCFEENKVGFFLGSEKISTNVHKIV